MSLADNGVCFDLDGVIALTEPLKAKAHTATVHHFGGKASFEDYQKIMGSSHETVRAKMMSVSGIHVDNQDYSQEFRRIYHELVESELVIRPGATELVGKLAALEARLAVVSSSTAAMVRQVLDIAGITGFFHAVVSADDVTRKKPDPEPYQKALEQLKIEPQRAVVIEDSPSGIEAGLKAGAHVIAVRHCMNLKQDFNRAELELEDFETPLEIVLAIQDMLRLEK